MAKVKKIPMRTCVVTKEVLPKKSLVRVAATKEGLVSVDLNGKAPGRGAYLKLSKEVINLAKKNKALDKKLEVVVPDAIYDELLTLANES
ncbi:MAG: YlxR family protein [Acholeplasmataceae bacterium]|nr:YlxR family protein [Acholeplasmataceae bacterium]